MLQNRRPVAGLKNDGCLLSCLLTLSAQLMSQVVGNRCGHASRPRLLERDQDQKPRGAGGTFLRFAGGSNGKAGATEDLLDTILPTLSYGPAVESPLGVYMASSRRNCRRQYIYHTRTREFLVCYRSWTLLKRTRPVRNGRRGKTCGHIFAQKGRLFPADTLSRPAQDLLAWRAFLLQLRQNGIVIASVDRARFWGHVQAAVSSGNLLLTECLGKVLPPYCPTQLVPPAQPLQLVTSHSGTGLHWEKVAFPSKRPAGNTSKSRHYTFLQPPAHFECGEWQSRAALSVRGIHL